VLTGAEARELEPWFRAAQAWSVSAQAMVQSATDLSNASRMLADEMIEGSPAAFNQESADHGPEMASQLRRLADTIEDDVRGLRDRYLTTAAELDLYEELLD
jgi:hypothetical protein